MEAYISIIRTLFWTVAMSGFLQVNPVYANALNTIKRLRDIKCPSDSIFYAPDNVKEQCIAKALRCVELELQYTVKGECDDQKKRIDQGLKVLRNTMEKWKKVYSKHTQRNVCRRVCEEWPETSFRDFLHKTKTLVQIVLNKRPT